MPTLAHHDRGLAEGPAQFHGLGLRGPEDQKTLLGRMVTRWSRGYKNCVVCVGR